MSDYTKYTNVEVDSSGTVMEATAPNGDRLIITTPPGKTFDDYTAGAAEHGVKYFDPNGEWSYHEIPAGEGDGPASTSSDEVSEPPNEPTAGSEDDGNTGGSDDGSSGEGTPGGDQGQPDTEGRYGAGKERLEEAWENYQDALDNYHDALDNFEDAISEAEDISSEIESLQGDAESIQDDMESLEDDMEDLIEDLEDLGDLGGVIDNGGDDISDAMQSIEGSQGTLDGLSDDFYDTDFSADGIGTGDGDQVDDPATDPIADAEPVHLYSGSFYVNHSDIHIPGIGPNLQITRHYNNQMYHKGTFGYKWDSILDAHIKELSDGTLYYWRGSGSGNFYLLDDDDEYVIPQGLFEQVTRSTTTIKVEDQYGTVRHFNRQRGGITKIVDRFGNELTMTRNASDQITQMTDESGKSLTIHYNAQGRVSSIEDFTGRVWQYDYDGAELESVTHPATTFNPTGKQVSYTYEQGGDVRMDHNLKTIRNHAGDVLVSNNYGSSTSSFNRVTSQNYTGDNFYFDYELVDDSLTDEAGNRHEVYRTTTIVNGKGNTKTYDFNIWGKPLEQRIETSGVRPGDPMAWTTKYRYDHYGNESEIEFHTGFKMQLTFDSDHDDARFRGNLLEMHRVASDGSETLTTSYEYGDFGQISKMTLPNNVFIDKTLDGNGLPTSITYPEVELPDGSSQQASETFVYNSRGQNTFFTNAVGDTYEYDYYDTGIKKGLLKRVLLNGDEIEEHRYDDLWRKTKVTNADGQQLNVAYNENDQVTSESGNPGSGIENQYVYDEEGQLVAFKVRNLDENGTPRVPEWIEHELEYDTRGRLTKTTTPLEGSTVAEEYFDYDAENNMTRYTDAENRVIEFVFDERNLLYQEIAAPGTNDESVSSFYYDGLANVTRIKDPLNRNYYNTYDGQGRLERSTDPMGNYKTFTYEDDELKTESLFNDQDDLYHRKTNFIDAIRRIYKVEADIIEDHNPTGTLTTQFFFDEKNRLTKTVDAGGNNYSIEYNAQDAVTAERNPDNNAIEYNYTDGGLIQQVKHVFKDTINGDQHVFVRDVIYDASGRMSSDTDALGNSSSYHWDSRNLMVGVTTPNGVRRTNTFDLNDRLTKTSIPWIGGDGANRGQVEAERIYDKSGLLKSYADGKGLLSHYSYDLRRNLKHLELPDGRQLYSNVYDEADNIIEQRDPNGNDFEYTYDRLGRLTRVDITKAAGTEGITFERFNYNALNQVTRMTNNDSTVVKSYDSIGRLTSETQNGATFEYQYNDEGLPEKMIYPSGMEVGYSWDTYSRLRSIILDKEGAQYNGSLSSGDTIAAYDYMGRMPIRITAGNDLSKVMEYDASGRQMTSRLEDGSGTVLARMTMLRDADGNVRYLHRDGIDSKSLYYDSLGQLEKVVEGNAGAAPNTASWIPSNNPSQPASSGNQNSMDNAVSNNAVNEGGASRIDAYAYDANGNRTSFDRSAGTDSFNRSYTVNDVNQYTDIDGLNPEYDDNGNMTYDGTHRYHYDSRNRLTSVYVDGTVNPLLELKYDNLNRNHDIDENGVSTSQQFAGNDMVESETGGVYTNRVMGLGKDQSVADNSGGASRFRDLNETRSTVTISDQNGAVLAHVVQDEFGNFIKALDANLAEIPLPAYADHLFHGRPEHAGIGLMNFRSRHYHTSLGRFMQQDGVGYASDDNLYRFVQNNPMVFIDPSGNYIESAWDALSLGLGVASLGYNLYHGNWGSAIIDGIGIVLDVVALALPIVPGGAGAAIKAYRMGDAALTAGTTAYRAERSVRLGQAGMHAVNAGRSLYNAQGEFANGNYGWGTFNLLMAGVGARGMGAKWYNAPRPTPRRPINSREASSAFPGQQGKLHFWGNGPWRPFSNKLSLLRNPRSPYNIRNIFSDDRPFRNVTSQYWRASGGARGNSLQHTFALNSGNMPRWFRNAGFNLVEVPGRINSWMGANTLRNLMFRGQVLTSMGIGGSIGGWGTKGVLDFVFGDGDPADMSHDPNQRLDGAGC